MNYIKASVTRPTGNPGKGINPKDMLILVDVDDIASFPARDGGGVQLDGDIVLKSGAYMVGVYLTPGTAEVTSASEGDPDAEGFKPSVKINHPGNEKPIRELKTNWIGRNCIAIVQYCNGKPSDLIGSPCNPVRLTASYTGNGEQNTNELTFEQAMKGDDVAIYTGAITMESPVATVSTATPAYAGDGVYLVTGDTAITNITGGAHGAVVTLKGGAGCTAALTAGETVLLHNGGTFVLSEGSQITLKAIKTGTNSVVWVEQSRYETA